MTELNTKSGTEAETQEARFKKLFLDDIRSAPDSSWDVVRSYEGFVEWLTANGCPDVVSFDHDLADAHYPTTQAQLSEEIDYSVYQEKTGYHAAQWLIDHGHMPKLVIVHSFNPVGARNIANLFSRDKAVIEPYPSPASLMLLAALESPDISDPTPKGETA